MPSTVLRVLVVVAAAAGCSAQESPPQIVMPSVVGMYWTDAEPQLRSHGWNGALVKGPDVAVPPGEHNRIVSQTPTPGEHLQPDTTITAQFGR